MKQLAKHLLPRLAPALAALWLSAPASAALPIAVDGEPLPSLAPMLEQVTPAVVNISTVTEIDEGAHPLLSDPFFRRFFHLPREKRERESQSLGSGMILDAQQGLVITNHHVVRQAYEIDVRLQDGREFSAELVGADPETDIAVLRIPAQELTALELGDSDKLKVGDFVAAIGSPFGLSHTVTSGIVSALGRSGLGIEGEIADPYEHFVDGNRIAPEVAGARLGDSTASADRGDMLAVAVGTVEQDSPAWLIGLREGDLLLAVNRKRVRNLQELGLILRQSRALVSLRIQRGERILQLSRR